MKYLLLLVISLVGNTLLISQASNSNPYSSAQDSAREIIDQLITTTQLVGLSVTVSHKDQVIWSEGFGHSDLNQTIQINPTETHFRIASISKPMTSTIMGRLVDEEILDLDGSVYDYVPTFPRKKYDFTLRHLASHRSGIQHYKKTETENTETLTISQGLDVFKKSKLKHKPGSDYLYSSYGYNLLGVAMENVTKSPFEDLLKQYVTDPLEMDHTIVDYGDYSDLTTSGFFIKRGKKGVSEGRQVYLAVKAPSGGLLSTSEDLVTFGNAYLYGRILQDETRIELLTDPPLPNGSKTGYGLGWSVSTDRHGRTKWSHTGGNLGSVCRLVIYPEQELTIAIVSNTSGIDFRFFSQTVLKVSNEFLVLAEK